MPSAAPRICQCGRIVQFGATCPCQRQRKAEADKRRPSARERGYTSKWEQARAEYLKLYPNCRRCAAPATVVDHVTPHKGDMKLFWNRGNWQSLCTSCHSRHKQREERRNVQ